MSDIDFQFFEHIPEVFTNRSSILIRGIVKILPEFLLIRMTIYVVPRF